MNTEPNSNRFEPITPAEANEAEESWSSSLREAIRCPDQLIDELGLPETLRAGAHSAAKLFPLIVPRSFLARMEPGNAADPLLRQVLPLDEEHVQIDGFVVDAVDDAAARKAPGLLHKYQGRALLISTGRCAVNCRYCFRRSYPYSQEPSTLAEWQTAIDYLAADSSLNEVILSGGDPLMLTDHRLFDLIDRLENVPHLERIRFHSRLPIVLPNRITSKLVTRLTSSKLQPIIVVHANHPNEIVLDCKASLARLVQSGIPCLNQAVLLRGVNDSLEALTELSLRLVNIGVMPYYLNLLDRVSGTAHFEVPEDTAVQLVEQMRTQLPGYAVPKLVRENSGEMHKSPVG